MGNGDTRRQKKRRRNKAMFEATMTDSFPKLMSDSKLQIQEAQKHQAG